MVRHALSRRAVLVALGSMAALPHQAFAKQIIDIDWDDLLPKGTPKIPRALRGTIDHDQAPLITLQPNSTGVRTEWNGKTVRLPGFMVPVEQRGQKVVTFILVPYVGACVHVPPPPENQLVLVTAKTPYKSTELFEPITVTGEIQTASMATHMARVGYAMTANKVEPYS